MDLIIAYINRRKFVTTAIKRTYMRCKTCEGSGYVQNLPPADDIIDALGYAFSRFARQVYTGFRPVTLVCPECDGVCFVPSVESELTREERDEAIRMYTKGKERKDRREKEKTMDKTWTRKSNRGDPRFK